MDTLSVLYNLPFLEYLILSYYENYDRLNDYTILPHTNDMVRVGYSILHDDGKLYDYHLVFTNSDKTEILNKYRNYLIKNILND